MIKQERIGWSTEIGDCCVDFGQISLNKKKEVLCGDYFSISESGDHHVLVLSDGLGSGVKANILATLTAKMLSTMLLGGVSLEKAIEAVAGALPVCSVRKLAYATFTVLDIVGDKVHLVQFDNPDAIFFRCGQQWDYPCTVREIDGKTIHFSYFRLQEEDMLILMSDGVTNAGMGKTTNGGWGRPEVVKYCRQKYVKGMGAQEMADRLALASVDLNLNVTDDDITILAVRLRKKQTVNLMIGPPHHTSDDERYLNAFFGNEGKHVICGGTTAQVAARYLGKPLTTEQNSSLNDVPSVSVLEGVDLVTEGFLTLQRLLEYCEDCREDPLMHVYVTKQRDAAARLERMLFETATEVNVFFGGAYNGGNEEAELFEGDKEEMVRQLMAILKKAGKKVNICMWAA